MSNNKIKEILIKEIPEQEYSKLNLTVQNLTYKDPLKKRIIPKRDPAKSTFYNCSNIACILNYKPISLFNTNNE